MGKSNPPPSKIIVMKFGGTSIGSLQAFENAVQIVKDAHDSGSKIIVVLSAMTGISDLLLRSVSDASAGRQDFINQVSVELRARHFEIAEELVLSADRLDQVKQEMFDLINDFSSLCQAIRILGEATPRAKDALASFGERLAVRLFAAVLAGRGVLAKYIDATDLIMTDDKFQAANPDFEITRSQTRDKLQPLLEKNVIPVVTGSIAASQQHATTTLGRGGSDYSAAIIGAVIPADEVLIWTDVDGVMTADPQYIREARSIPVLSYKEVAELAYSGAKVLHPKTIRPAIEKQIPLRVVNTFNPGAPGTRLVADRTLQGNGGIKAVTGIRGLSLITLEGRGMMGVPGVAARTFQAVAGVNMSIPLISQASSEQSICFTVPKLSAASVIAAVEASFAEELAHRDIDRIWASDEIAIITAVGMGMRNTPGIAGRIFSALGSEKINVMAIAQGSSEVSISLVVNANVMVKGLQTVHSLISF